MNILITGAFGNIGRLVLDQALQRGHAVSVLEIDNKKTRRAARRVGKRARIYLGDIRDARFVTLAAEGQDVVVHMAGILPPTSERNQDLCRSVNVGGTENLVKILLKQANPASLVFVSSVAVMGQTQGRKPPVRAEDPMHPENQYARTKAEAEDLVAGSGLRHCVLRLSAVMPTEIPSSTAMFAEAFSLPLDVRCEILVDVDAAAACLSAAESLAAGKPIDGRRFLIGGGGKNGCQVKTRDMLEGVFRAVGLPLPNEALFPDPSNGYSLDWYDTEAAESALHFQNHTFGQYRTIISRRFRSLRPLIRLFRPLIVGLIARKSPYWGRATA